MIVISRERLKFLLAGRELDIELDRMPARPYRKHHIYAVGVSHKRGTCHAEVLEVDGSDEMGWTLRIKQAGVDPTYFLAPKSGYVTTHDPLDAGAVPPKSAVKTISQEARDRFDATRANDIRRERLRTLAIRLRAASKSGDLSALREIRQEIERIEREAA